MRRPSRVESFLASAHSLTRRLALSPRRRGEAAAPTALLEPLEPRVLLSTSLGASQWVPLAASSPAMFEVMTSDEATAAAPTADTSEDAADPTADAPTADDTAAGVMDGDAGPLDSASKGGPPGGGGVTISTLATTGRLTVNQLSGEFATPVAVNTEAKMTVTVSPPKPVRRSASAPRAPASSAGRASSRAASAAPRPASPAPARPSRPSCSTSS